MHTVEPRERFCTAKELGDLHQHKGISNTKSLISQYGVNRKSHALIEWYLPFFMLFSQYDFGLVSLGTVGLLLVAFATVVEEGLEFKLSSSTKMYLPFLCYVVVSDVMRSLFGIGDVTNQLNRLLTYVVMFGAVFVVSSRPFKEDKLYSSWKIAGTIYTLGMLYQSIQVFALGLKVEPISLIPGYALREPSGVSGNRPLSFFAEPASYAVAMMPLLFISLRRRDFLWAVITTLGVLLSTSTVGVALSGVLWAYMFLKGSYPAKTKIAVVGLIVLIAVLYVNASPFEASFEKTLAVSEGESTVAARLVCGFQVISTLNPLEMILGAPYHSADDYVGAHLTEMAGMDEALRYWMGGHLFLNSFTQIVFRYGAIGLGLLFAVYIAMLRKKDYTAKSFVIMVIVATFVQSMLLNSYFFEITMLILLYDNMVLAASCVANGGAVARSPIVSKKISRKDEGVRHFRSLHGRQRVPKVERRPTK